MDTQKRTLLQTYRRYLPFIVGLMLMVVSLIVAGNGYRKSSPDPVPVALPKQLVYQPRINLDPSGYSAITKVIQPWGENATLAEISDAFRDIGIRTVKRLDQRLAQKNISQTVRIDSLFMKSLFLNYDGEPRKAYEALEAVRSFVESNESLSQLSLYSVVYLEGISALRLGENENCIMCRGESSCILPISAAAVHTKPEGSRLAIKHFMEYLAQFPDDLEVRWLLNVAHMTLGEHPDRVDPRFVISLDHFRDAEFDIGRFRDVGHIIGLNRLNYSGGAIMEDFDNDGLLDIVVSTLDPTAHMDFYHNSGDGTFEVHTETAGLKEQLGGLNCVQTDYNNDGHMDIFVVRGAWLHLPIRPSLLRNNGNLTFTDVTEEAGLNHPVNSISSSWSDYDNDGWLDVFVCCERQPSRLYHNERDGTFVEVAEQAGIHLPDQFDCKGAAWLDYDNDGAPDLFLNFLKHASQARLFHNNGKGTFQEVTTELGIDGPLHGFSCWAFDFDNDGWLDIFATCFRRTLVDVVKGIQGLPNTGMSNRLFHNQQGRKFKDVTEEAGLKTAYATMGSNFGDFDNDGFLDMYLGTGSPDLAFLVPNVMLKNVAGKRFSDITAPSGTGSLQKGHGVACGDWDRDGNVDIFIEMGGAVGGDQYHNIMFQNPGQNNRWLTLKLVGQKTNRAAIGARIKVVTSGDSPLTVYRHISSGSSFGANPLQQTIGLGKAQRIDLLEIQWPTSGTTQSFRDLTVDQSIKVTEFADNFETLDWEPIPGTN